MENASRALVIAGGVLLSLIIIGVVMFAYRGITSLQKEKDISLSNEQVSKINEQIEKYTKKSVIYGSEVLSICNAIEDYSRKYPRSDEGYPKITAIIKIKADGKDNDIKECFKDEYDGIQSLKNDYNEAIRIRDVNGKTTISNGKTIEELYNFLETGGENGDKLNSYFELYGLNDSPTTTLILLKRYELYKGYINTFREKRFKASVEYSNTTGIIKKIEIQPK